MNRGRLSLASLLVVIPVLVYTVFVWMNWQPAGIATADEGQWLHVRVGGGQLLEVRLGELLLVTFALGVGLGLLAMLLAVAGRRADDRVRIEQLSHDNRRLGAANRALEAALPVLRERYDTALGVFSPAPPAAPAAPPPTAPPTASPAVPVTTLEPATAGAAAPPPEPAGALVEDALMTDVPLGPLVQEEAAREAARRSGRRR